MKKMTEKQYMDSNTNVFYIFFFLQDLHGCVSETKQLVERN